MVDSNVNIAITIWQVYHITIIINTKIKMINVTIMWLIRLIIIEN